MELEIRASGTLRAASPGHLTGYAAVFGSEANLGDFIEIIRPGAFAKSLESGMNIRALYHHEGSALLGTTRGGTLKLAEDSKGLRFDLALPGTTHGKDLAILVDRGGRELPICAQYTAIKLKLPKVKSLVFNRDSQGGFYLSMEDKQGAAGGQDAPA